MQATSQYDKCITNEIAFINSLRKPQHIIIYWKKERVDKKTKMLRNGNSFFISTKMRTRLFADAGLRTMFNVKSAHLDAKVTDAYVKSLGYPDTTIKIDGFSSSKFNKKSKYYCRKIIPLSHPFKFADFFEEGTYSSNDNFRRRGIIEVSVNEKKFHLFSLKRDDRDFLFIDCLTKTTHEEFSEISWSILVGIGYISGYLPQDEEYYFYYRNKKMDIFCSYGYRTLRHTIKTFYTPINTNPFAWIGDYETAKEYHYKINNLNYRNVCTLCQLIHDNIEIKALILLFIESLKSSMLMMPAGLCVVLEGLSEFAFEKHDSLLKPITDPKVAKQFRSDLISVLKTYANKDCFKNGYGSIEKKIHHINKPTNREKLKSPFTVYGIEISQMDEDVIDYRNEFLHGNINLKPRNGKNFKMDSFEVSLRLMTLINCALMKMIGYDGHVLNHVKIQSQESSKHIDEGFYRMLK